MYTDGMSGGTPRAPIPSGVAPHSLVDWITEEDPFALDELQAAAAKVRRTVVGDAVHLRGLIEISNHCRCNCRYCGLRRPHRDLVRYRMSAQEILQATQQALALGCGTVVLQAGEDPGLTQTLVSDLVRRIKAETGLAITLSLGERTPEELQAWRRAGADRYFMRFETSDPDLFAHLHPGSSPADAGASPSHPSKHLATRIDLLRGLRNMGYEVGSGFMVGLPGQTAESLAQDLLLCRHLDLDMIGIGPYVPDPQTPIGAPTERMAETWALTQAEKLTETPGGTMAGTSGDTAGETPTETTSGARRETAPGGLAIQGTEAQVCRLVALARLICPEANIPSTTALATISQTGREAGLQWGANVWMPNLTPQPYRDLYSIYPGKPSADIGTVENLRRIQDTLASIDRVPGTGPGPRTRSRDHAPCD